MELLVVMLILSVLTMFAVPAYVDFTDRTALRTNADSVASLIASVRTEAVRSGQNITITKMTSGARWCVGARQAATPALGQPYSATAVSACDCFASSCIVAGQQRALVFDPSEPNVARSAATTVTFTIDGKTGTLLNWAAGTPEITMESGSGAYDVNIQVSYLGTPAMCTPGDKTMVGVPVCE